MTFHYKAGIVALGKHLKSCEGICPQLSLEDRNDLSLQGGADNLLGPLALRGVLNIGFTSGTELAVDVLNYFPKTRQLAPYLGGGRALGLSAQYYEFHATGGLEYFVDSDIALFAELQPALVVVPGFNPGFGANLRFGANYHFD